MRLRGSDIEELGSTYLGASVYGVVDVRNMELLYVGSTGKHRKRWQDHARGLATGKHANRALQREWEKRGDWLDVVVLRKCKNQDEARPIETGYLMDFYKRGVWLCNAPPVRVKEWMDDYEAEISVGSFAA